MTDCQVDIKWDPESFVWAATSRDLEGFALEDPSLDRLTERVRQSVSALPGCDGQSTRLIFRYDGPDCR